MAKDPDAKKDAAEKKAGKPDSDTPKIAALEKKLGVGGAGKVGKGAAPMNLNPGQAFGANRRMATPVPGPVNRSKKPAVGMGGEGYVKKGGLGGFAGRNKSGGSRD